MDPPSLGTLSLDPRSSPQQYILEDGGREITVAYDGALSVQFYDLLCSIRKENALVEENSIATWEKDAPALHKLKALFSNTNTLDTQNHILHAWAVTVWVCFVRMFESVQWLASVCVRVYHVVTSPIQ